VLVLVCFALFVLFWMAIGFVGFPFGVALSGIVFCILGRREPVNLYKSGAGHSCVEYSAAARRRKNRVNITLNFPMRAS